MAADITSDVPSTTETKSLPCVQVDGTALNEYKVDKLSAPKFTQPLLDTTQTISVISKELMQEQGATTLTEALLNSPDVGTSARTARPAAGDGVYMRGIDTSSSIFVDGVRDLGSISRDVFNIEQMEVTKSPASTDNGRTAPTGSINMMSMQPELGSGLTGSVSYGGGDHRRATADWNQSIGETSAFRLNVMGQDSGIPGRDKVENNRWAILAYALKSSLTIWTTYHLPFGLTPMATRCAATFPTRCSSPNPRHTTAANSSSATPMASMK